MHHVKDEITPCNADVDSCVNVWIQHANVIQSDHWAERATRRQDSVHARRAWRVWRAIDVIQDINRASRPLHLVSVSIIALTSLVTVSRPRDRQNASLTYGKDKDCYTGFLMKLFRTTNIDVLQECKLFFDFLLPSKILEIRRDKFNRKLVNCSSVLNYFGLGIIVWNV